MDPNSLLTLLTERGSAGHWRLAGIGGRDSVTGCWSLAALRMLVESWHAFPVGMVHVDVPGLRWMNDRLGHDGGDLFLRDVAHRLARALPPEPELLLARTAGDEFSALTPSPMRLVDLASDVRAVLAEPRYCRAISKIQDQDHVVKVTLAPYGAVTVTGEAGWDLDRLLRSAEELHNTERRGTAINSTKPQIIDVSVSQ